MPGWVSLDSLKTPEGEKVAAIFRISSLSSLPLMFAAFPRKQIAQETGLIIFFISEKMHSSNRELYL